MLPMIFSGQWQKQKQFFQQFGRKMATALVFCSAFVALGPCLASTSMGLSGHVRIMMLCMGLVNKL